MKELGGKGGLTVDVADAEIALTVRSFGFFHSSVPHRAKIAQWTASDTSDQWAPSTTTHALATNQA